MRRQHINGYSCDEHGERIIHYVCDPKKNPTCKKTGCAYRRTIGDRRGYCDTTLKKEARREGTRPFYIKIKKSAKVTFAREYIEEAEK